MGLKESLRELEEAGRPLRRERKPYWVAAVALVALAIACFAVFQGVPAAALAGNGSHICEHGGVRYYFHDDAYSYVKDGAFIWVWRGETLTGNAANEWTIGATGESLYTDAPFGIWCWESDEPRGIVEGARESGIIRIGGLEFPASGSLEPRRV